MSFNTTNVKACKITQGILWPFNLTASKYNYLVSHRFLFIATYQQFACTLTTLDYLVRIEAKLV